MLARSLLPAASRALARSIRRAHPGVRRFAEGGMEHACEVIGGQRRHASQLSQRERGVQVRVHVVHDAPAHGGGQAAARGLRRLARHALVQQLVQHGLGGAAGRQPFVGAAPVRAQQRAAYVGQRVVVDIGAVAQFQRARLAVQPHDGFAGQALRRDVQMQEAHVVVHAPARVMLGGQHAELARAAMQRVQADAEGFSPPRRYSDRVWWPGMS